jgi:hypothetical protein
VLISQLFQELRELRRLLTTQMAPPTVLKLSPWPLPPWQALNSRLLLAVSHTISSSGSWSLYTTFHRAPAVSMQAGSSEASVCFTSGLKRAEGKGSHCSFLCRRACHSHDLAVSSHKASVNNHVKSSFLHGFFDFSDQLLPLLFSGPSPMERQPLTATPKQGYGYDYPCSWGSSTS